MKKFDIKIYDRLKEYKTTINPNNVMNAISFSSNLDGWQGQLTLDLTKEVEIDCGDIIEVYCYDNFNKSWMLLYCGFVSEMNNIYSPKKSYISLKCLWLWSLLWTSYYEITGTETKTITEHITDLVNDYNSIYWTNLFSVGTIEDESTVDLSFSNEGTFLKKLEIITKSGDNFFRVDQEWKINVLKRPTVSTHTLTYKKDVEQLNLSYNIESIVNQYRIDAYCSDDWWNYSNVYSDNASIAQYWVKSLYRYTNEFRKKVWVDNRALWLLADTSTPKNNTTAIVNLKYDILKISPWQSVSILNIEKEIENLQIKKTSFTPEKITLVLEEAEKFSDYLAFKNNNE